MFRIPTVLSEDASGRRTLEDGYPAALTATRGYATGILMVGQVGWQVHVRIPTVPSEDASSCQTLNIVPGTPQKGVSAFFQGHWESDWGRDY